VSRAVRVLKVTVAGNTPEDAVDKIAWAQANEVCPERLTSCWGVKKRI
jgi:hypothetical protein